MPTHNLSKKLAAGFLVSLALLAACSTDSASRMTAPQLSTSSSNGATVFKGPSAAVFTFAPSLGLAANFAALGGAGVTCTSPNPPLPAITISGNVGSLLAAPSSVTGFPGFTPGALPCRLSGTVQLGAAAASANFITAYNTLAALPCPSDAPHNLSGDLGGLSLAPGIYCISGVGLLSSKLTLNGGANETWIFKAASSLTPIGGSVVMAGGGNACNVYWELGSSASFNNTSFVGNVLAGAAITFTGTNSSLAGRALAQTDVTLTGASITNCAASAGNGNGNGDGNGNGNGDDDKDNRGKGGDKDHGDDHGNGHDGNGGDRSHDRGNDDHNGRDSGRDN